MGILEQIDSAVKARSLVRKTVVRHGKAYCASCRCHRRMTVLGDGRYWCKICRTKRSLKQLAGFSGSKLSWKQIATITYCFVRNHTLEAVMDFAQVSYPTARRYYDILREKAALYVDTHALPPCGDMAMDACFVGKQKNNNQAVVLGVVTTDFTRLALDIVPQEEQGYVEKFLFDHVHHIGGHIRHDGHKAYNGLAWTGLSHSWEYHNKGQFELTSCIERIWALLKTFLIRRYHHVTKEKLPLYLKEFQFKFLHKSTGVFLLDYLQFLTLPVPTA